MTVRRETPLTPTEAGRPTPADQLELIARARSGDTWARELLVEANLGLVGHVVKRFTGRGFEDEDLHQIGCLGLIKAIDRFDLGFGVRFSTYAVPMILGEIRRYLRDTGPVKVSRRLKGLAARARQAREELGARLGREPTINELAGRLEIEAGDVLDALEATRRPTSFQLEVGEDGSDPIFLLDRVAADREGGERWFENIAVREAVARLEPRKRKIILWRFFRDLTQAEVADLCGISQVHVSRLEKQALAEMRAALGGEEQGEAEL